jgi:chromosome segregation ATPase
MKEELTQAQQFAAEREAARKALEGDLAEALQRIASMERAQRAMEEEMRSAKMAVRQSLPAIVDDGQITLLKDKIARLEGELQHAKTSAASAIIPTSNKRVSLDSMSADELKSNYETLSIRNDLVQEELQRVQGMCDRLQDELMRVRTDAAADRDACNTLQLSLVNEKAASDALEQSLHALQSELSSVYSKLHAQESNGSSLQRLEQEMKMLQRQASTAADHLRTKEGALLDLQRKLTDEISRYAVQLRACGHVSHGFLQVGQAAGCLRRRC